VRGDEGAKRKDFADHARGMLVACKSPEVV